MASSELDYDLRMSDDDDQDINIRGARNGVPDRTRDPGKAKAVGTKPKEKTARARWEATAQKNWDLQEGADGDLEGVLGGIEEASKRAR